MPDLPSDFIEEIEQQDQDEFDEEDNEETGLTQDPDFITEPIEFDLPEQIDERLKLAESRLNSEANDLDGKLLYLWQESDLETAAQLIELAAGKTATDQPSFWPLLSMGI